MPYQFQERKMNERTKLQGRLQAKVFSGTKICGSTLVDVLQPIAVPVRDIAAETKKWCCSSEKKNNEEKEAEKKIITYKINNAIKWYHKLPMRKKKKLTSVSILNDAFLPFFGVLLQDVGCLPEYHAPTT